MSTSSNISPGPENPTESHAESADRHDANKARSAANLDEARRRAARKSQYDSAATRSRLKDLFRDTWHCEARDWQIDITEAMLLGLDSVLIAGPSSTIRFQQQTQRTGRSELEFGMDALAGAT